MSTFFFTEIEDQPYLRFFVIVVFIANRVNMDIFNTGEPQNAYKYIIDKIEQIRYGTQRPTLCHNS
jgi:hypothetical protein